MMSKVVVLLVTLCVVFIVTACGNAEKSSVVSKSVVATTQSKVESQQQYLKITINNKVLKAKLVDNSSTQALVKKLKEKPLTLEMSDFSNFEKVGELGFSLPRNDEHIVTGPGDLILYQGSRFVLYYDTNTWDFTRLGKIEDINQAELKQLLGPGDVKATLSL